LILKHFLAQLLYKFIQRQWYICSYLSLFSEHAQVKH